MVSDEVGRCTTKSVSRTRQSRVMNDEVGELSLSESDELRLERDNRRIVILCLKYRSFYTTPKENRVKERRQKEKSPKA